MLDYSCRVVAFNAIINRAAPIAECRLVNEENRDLQREAVVRNRGSRHQSALYYAMNTPNSFAFVISQDGGISAFHNRGDGTVVCERNLRVLG